MFITENTHLSELANLQILRLGLKLQACGHLCNRQKKKHRLAGCCCGRGILEQLLAAYTHCGSSRALGILRCRHRSPPCRWKSAGLPVWRRTAAGWSSRPSWRGPCTRRWRCLWRPGPSSWTAGPLKCCRLCPAENRAEYARHVPIALLPSRNESPQCFPPHPPVMRCQMEGQTADLMDGPCT